LILYTFCGLLGLIAFLMSQTPTAIATRLGIFGIGFMIVCFAGMMWVRWRYQLRGEK
jgi:hypothetical protein